MSAPGDRGLRVAEGLGPAAPAQAALKGSTAAGALRPAGLAYLVPLRVGVPPPHLSSLLLLPRGLFPLSPGCVPRAVEEASSEGAAAQGRALPGMEAEVGVRGLVPLAELSPHEAQNLRARAWGAARAAPGN